jgi:hypothetical protein
MEFGARDNRSGCAMTIMHTPTSVHMPTSDGAKDQNARDRRPHPTR